MNQRGFRNGDLTIKRLALIEPMLAKSGELPANDSDHAFEFKWDGMRAIIALDRGRTSVQSRNMLDFTANFPELQALGAAHRSKRVILDGESIVSGKDGSPNFEMLQPRIRGGTLRGSAPAATFMAFDVLSVGGRNLMQRPFSERRRVLEGLGLDGDCWKTPPSMIGDGAAIMDVCRKHKLEGIVAKRLSSRYEQGRRSGAWTKIKNFKTKVFRIGGWLPGERGQVEAVLVGKPARGGRLSFAGIVEFGVLWRLKEPLKLLSSAENPFVGYSSRKAQFVSPRLTATVKFIESSMQGVLRHAAVIGVCVA